MSRLVPTPSQTRILGVMASGAVIYTTVGLYPRAWIFAKTFEGVLGALRFTVPFPTLDVMLRNGWITNTTDYKRRLRGSTYTISRLGLAAWLPPKRAKGPA